MTNAISEPRNVNIHFSNAHDTVDGSETAQVSAPLDAYKAVLKKVEEIEGRFAKLGASGVADLTDASVLVTGSLPFQIHVFTVTSVMATGVYEFIYVETVPDASQVS